MARREELCFATECHTSTWHRIAFVKVQQLELCSTFGFFGFSLCLSIEDTAFEAGIRVQIHSQAEPPFVHELGFGVSPGFQTFVSTQEQRLTYLPPPWGECRSRALESGFFQVYSVTACRIDCETRYIVENCNCRMVHMPATLFESENQNCICRNPCNMTRYNKELSMVKIPSKTSSRYLEKKFNKSEKYIADNILVLDVFFEALNYETIEQKKAYEVAGLLGQSLYE
ncbi:hypothetical protein Z043_122006 [Scleropages formosus]|uniref:Acid-sensing ion channel 2-like n=1 Tax=Scleropages formosus TaxID=113540 RepID=A0A0P7UKT7_SCLFO|nr:hypothetical protein Z043_122006 [Scleropages formosus]